MIRTGKVTSGLLPPVGTVGKARASLSPLTFALALSRASRGGAPVGEVSRRRSESRLGTPASGKPSASGPTAFEELVRGAAQREGVDPQLVKAVVEAESNFNPRAVSSAGAKGLMQLMDGTARALGVRDSFDPVSNVAGGVKYLRTMLDRFGSIPLALAAYNAGPGAVEKFGGIPPYRETKVYVERVTQLHRRNLSEAAAKVGEGGANDRGRIA